VHAVHLAAVSATHCLQHLWFFFDAYIFQNFCFFFFFLPKKISSFIFLLIRNLRNQEKNLLLENSTAGIVKCGDSRKRFAPRCQVRAVQTSRKEMVLIHLPTHAIFRDCFFSILSIFSNYLSLQCPLIIDSNRKKRKAKESGGDVVGLFSSHSAPIFFFCFLAVLPTSSKASLQAAKSFPTAFQPLPCRDQRHLAVKCCGSFYPGSA
jgi:hypothetical protein